MHYAGAPQEYVPTGGPPASPVGRGTRYSMSQMSGLEVVSAITRNHGSNRIAAYWDDLQLMTAEPPASSYDVQVATDAGFTDLIETTTGQSAQSFEVGSLTKGTTYHWRVRATNAAGTGLWSEDRFTTIDRAPRRYYIKDHLGSIRAVVDPDASGSEDEQLRWSLRRWWRPATTTPLASGCPGEA